LGVISASIGPAVGLKVVEIKHHVLLVGQDGRALQIQVYGSPHVQGRSPGRLPSPAQRAGFREELPFRGNAPAICSRSVVQMIGALPLWLCFITSQPVGLG